MYDNEKLNKYIYVLDLDLLKSICDKLDISYNIHIELPNGFIRKTSEVLHKEFIIQMILDKLLQNKSSKVIYSLKIQCYDTKRLTKKDYVYYGQYKTTNKNIYNLLLELTNNEFRFGAISQKIIKDYWRKNKLITYEQFAKLWMKEYSSGDIKYKELAYNQFMKKYGNTVQWYKLKNDAVDYFTTLGLL